MPTGFVLLEASPGREREVLDDLAAVPGVVGRQVLFGSSIACKLDGPALPAAVETLRQLAGVRSARLYPARNA